MEITDQNRLALIEASIRLIANDPDPRAPEAIEYLQQQHAELINRIGKPETQVVGVKSLALHAQRK